MKINDFHCFPLIFLTSRDRVAGNPAAAARESSFRSIEVVYLVYKNIFLMREPPGGVSAGLHKCGTSAMLPENQSNPIVFSYRHCRGPHSPCQAEAGLGRPLEASAVARGRGDRKRATRGAPGGSGGLRGPVGTDSEGLRGSKSSGNRDFLAILGPKCKLAGGRG